MQHAYDLIREADFFALMFVSGLFFFIGKSIGGRFSHVFQLGALIAGIAFLAYCGTAITEEGYEPIENLAAYVLRGGLEAGVVAGAFWTVAALLLNCWSFVAPVPRYFERKHADARRRAEAQIRAQQEAADRQRREEYERVEREAARQRLDGQQKAAAELARQKAVDQQRRTEARAQCELLYSLYAKDIADRYPKPRLNSFMQTYMNDSQPAEIVERRGKELREIIEQHRLAARPPTKCHFIQELADWFVAEKQRIESLPLDEELREEHLVQLNMRYAELTQNMLQKMEP